jgi:hypothetical protein
VARLQLRIALVGAVSHAGHRPTLADHRRARWPRDALADRSTFRPRAWMLANMTDAICSAALLDIIRDGAEHAR